MWIARKVLHDRMFVVDLKRTDWALYFLQFVTIIRWLLAFRNAILFGNSKLISSIEVFTLFEEFIWKIFFCNIISVYTLTLEQFNTSLIYKKKSINFFGKKKGVGGFAEEQ